MLNVVRVDICVLFLILEEMFLAFHHYDVSLKIVTYGLYYTEVGSLFAHVLEYFFFYLS